MKCSSHKRVWDINWLWTWSTHIFYRTALHFCKPDQGPSVQNVKNENAEITIHSRRAIFTRILIRLSVRLSRHSTRNNKKKITTPSQESSGSVGKKVGKRSTFIITRKNKSFLQPTPKKRALWSRIIKNPDWSTGLLVGPFARSLTSSLVRQWMTMAF